MTPVRDRVLAAKLLVGGLAGAALVVPALVLMLVIAEVWVGDRLDFSGHEWQLIGRVFLAAAIVGALGVEIGACTARQLGAIIVAFAWVAFAEPRSRSGTGSRRICPSMRSTPFWAPAGAARSRLVAAC